jgi:hypothetical protein
MQIMGLFIAGYPMISQITGVEGEKMFYPGTVHGLFLYHGWGAPIQIMHDK